MNACWYHGNGLYIMTTEAVIPSLYPSHCGAGISEKRKSWHCSHIQYCCFLYKTYYNLWKAIFNMYMPSYNHSQSKLFNASVCRVEEWLLVSVAAPTCTLAPLWALLGHSSCHALVCCGKVVILEYHTSGKVSWAHQFVEGEFFGGCIPTVENTHSNSLSWQRWVRLHLVDRAVQDEYSILPYSFITGILGNVFVYSVTSLHSFPSH